MARNKRIQTQLRILLFQNIL